MMAVLELQQVIVTQLRSSQNLVDKLGGTHIYDDAPKQTKPPFIEFGKMVHSDWSTDTETGLEHALELDIWSGQRGRKEIVAIATDVVDQLAQPITLANQHLVNLQFLSLEIGRSNKDGFLRGTLKFRAVTEPASQ